MKRKFIAFIAAIAALFVVTGSAFGFTPVDASTWLSVDVAWLDGFTAHLDTGAMLATAAVAGVKEQIEEAVKELRANIEKTLEPIQEKLRANLKEQVGELETRIQKGEALGTSVADLKEKSAQMSKDNAESISKMEALVKKHADDINAKVDELLKGKGVIRTGEGEPADLGAAVVELVKANGINQNSQNRRVIKQIDGSIIPRHKTVTISSSTVYPSARVPGIMEPAVRKLRIRDLLPVNRTSERTIYFVKETARTDGAAMQTEGSAKGESHFTYDVTTETVKTVAHFIRIATQQLDDLPGLEDSINNRLLWMLMNYEEYQILYGNAQGQNLNGLFTQATAFDTTLLTELGVTSATDIDRIRAAIAQVEVAEYPPDGVIMHPYNWASIEMRKESTLGYIFASPQNMSAPRLWGLPVVSTTQVASPDFLVGAFQLGAALWDRQESSIAISTEDANNFTENKATVRAEERIALTVYRPASFVEGDFAQTIT